MPRSVGGRGDLDWDTGVTNVIPPEPSKADRAYLIVLAGDGLGEMHQLLGAEMIIGRAGRATILLRDDGISRQHARLRRVADGFVLEDLQSRNGTYLNGNRVTEPTLLRDGDKIHLGHRTVLRLTFHDALDDAFQHQLREAAMYDALTRAYSRRYFVDRLEAELQFASRHLAPLALVLIDLDHLKHVNDHYGHGAGDRMLVDVAAVIHAHVRGEDLFGRLGGDEFGVICRGTPLAVAATFAERVRTLVADTSIDVGPVRMHATVSVGVAALPDVAADTPEQLMSITDRALYVAKARGRNRVAVHPEEAEVTHTYRGSLGLEATRQAVKRPSSSPGSRDSARHSALGSPCAAPCSAKDD